MTIHQAIAVAVALKALAAAPAAAQAEPTLPIAVDHVYLEQPPAVRLFLRFGGETAIPAAGELRAEVVVNDVPIPVVRVAEPSDTEAATAVLFLLDTSKNMEGWVATVKRALQSYLEEEAKDSPALNRFGLSTFTTTRSELIPFSAAQTIQHEAFRGLRSGQQARVQVWESCEVAVGRFETNPVDAAGSQLPVRRYLVIVTNGQGNSDDTGRERCLKAALGAQVPVIVVGPRPASRTLRAMRDIAEGSLGRYLEVRGPNDLPSALKQLRTTLAAVRLRLVEFDIGDAAALLDTNNKLVVTLKDSRGAVVASSERLFNSSEAFRGWRHPGPTVPDAAPGDGQDEMAEGGEPEAPEAAPAAAQDRQDATDAGDAGAGSEAEESSSGWLLWVLIGAGILAVVVIAMTVVRSRRRRCPTCGGPLAAGEELCADCRAATSPSKLPAGPKLLAELLIREGPKKGERISLFEETVLLGRDPEKCKAVIDDEAVSRVHATLRRFPEGWRITDMSSSYGISLGGRKISPEKWADLSDGETIKIGNVELVFLDKTKGRKS